MFIGECGHRVWSATTKTCRACWLEAKRLPPTRCLDCGLPLSKGEHGGRSKSQRCWDCFVKSSQSVIPCEDCGKPRRASSTYQSGGVFSRLCRECYDLERSKRSKEKRCKLPDCNDPIQGEGLCNKHLKMKRRRENTSNLNKTKVFKAYIRTLPCILCGFDKWGSECARIIAGGLYEPGNVVPLCRNCHYGFDHGYLTLPDKLPDIHF